MVSPIFCDQICWSFSYVYWFCKSRHLDNVSFVPPRSLHDDVLAVQFWSQGCRPVLCTWFNLGFIELSSSLDEVTRDDVPPTLPKEFGASRWPTHHFLDPWLFCTLFFSVVGLPDTFYLGVFLTSKKTSAKNICVRKVSCKKFISKHLFRMKKKLKTRCHIPSWGKRDNGY